MIPTPWKDYIQEDLEAGSIQNLNKLPEFLKCAGHIHKVPAKRLSQTCVNVDMMMDRFG